MLRKEIILFREVFKISGENISDENINSVGKVVFRKVFELTGEVKGMEKEGLSRVSIKECVSM